MAAIPPKKRKKIVSHCCKAPLTRRLLGKGKVCSRCGSLCSDKWTDPAVKIEFK